MNCSTCIFDCHEPGDNYCEYYLKDKLMFNPQPKNKPVRLSPYKWELLKKECFTRDGFKCRSCGRQFTEDSHGLDAHHIKNRSQGGGDTIENLVSVCRFPCHRGITDKKIDNDFIN